MKKTYRAPQIEIQCLTLEETLLADAVDGGSFQDGWNDVNSRFTDEF